MEKRSKKHDAILEASRKLFYRYGLRKVSVEDICKEANCSKMTFYKFFPNKVELAKTMLDRTFNYWLEKFWEVMRSEKPFADKMHLFLEMKASANADTSKDFMEDLYYSEDSVLKEYMSEWIGRSLKETIAMFTYAQEQGWMRKDLKPELMLYIMNRLIDSVRDDKLLNMYDSVQQLGREITKFFLYGVFDEK
ncbi:TetR/AcrR family transcriptional regulator [Parabacteroides sp. PF5-9]|uniref:TetR/AcrR family transcriptional regulator n=1 Tax=Parabacteroides sp. PF5-9 TaxID=1742404 RepID=UPI002473C07C|nr:TetR/AcrR family transcriptional regulator [Parabacteroides sp. PF5-9]MDH6359263.1 AcrR family transcriptional regulator [Parabacteroides sp. PF5-9]